MPHRLTLAELVDSSLALTPSDAIAIVVQLARAPHTGGRPRPIELDASHIRLDGSGSVTLAPGVLPRPGEVAALLEQVLAPMGDAVPRALRAMLSRAAFGGAGTPVPSLSALGTALAPFQPPDPAAAVRGLVARFHAPRPVLPSPGVDDVTATSHAADTIAPAGSLDTAAPIDTTATASASDAPVEAASWRPAARHVGAAAAAALLAAMAGGLLARTAGTSPPPAPPPMPAASAPRAASVETPAAEPAPTLPPSPPSSEATPARSAPTGQPATTARPAVATTAAAADARPARLVDHRDVDADAVFSPSFAPDGTAVFFHAASGGGSALKRADAGGGELRVASIVDDGARNYHVQLSPDGRHVAFDSDRDGVRGVYVAGADGRGVRRISGPGYAAVPTWSPDGRQLAFLRAEADRPATWNLWLQDRASGRETRVTAFRSGQVWGGAWFADGRRIAYSHEDRLTIHDLASGERRDVVSPLPGRQVRTPAVSPDGRWVVFQVHRDGVWLFDVERGTTTRVLDDPSAEEFAWAPDGRRVAYHSRRSGGWNLWTMTVP